MNPSAPTAPLPDPAVLHGAGRYEFTARIDGDDLVVQGVRATWFGGANDPQDNGETASGLSTRLHPELLGCALPMDGFRATAGSPLPRLPWLTTHVVVTRPANGRSVTVALVDLGPSAPPRAHAAIDLTVAAFRALGGNLRTGVLAVDYRIPGGALRLPSNVLLAARAAAAHPAAAHLPRAAQAQGNPAPAAPNALAANAAVPAATGADQRPSALASTLPPTGVAPRGFAPGAARLDTVEPTARETAPDAAVAVALSASPSAPLDSGTQDPAPRGTATGLAGPAVPPV